MMHGPPRRVSNERETARASPFSRNGLGAMPPGAAWHRSCCARGMHLRSGLPCSLLQSRRVRALACQCPSLFSDEQAHRGAGAGARAPAHGGRLCGRRAGEPFVARGGPRAHASRAHRVAGAAVPHGGGTRAAGQLAERVGGGGRRRVARRRRAAAARRLTPPGAAPPAPPGVRRLNPSAASVYCLRVPSRTPMPRTAPGRPGPSGVPAPAREGSS